MSEIAPDGSPVAFYRRLPATGEPELINAAIPVGGTILDLGLAFDRWLDRPGWFRAVRDESS